MKLSSILLILSSTSSLVVNAFLHANGGPAVTTTVSSSPPLLSKTRILAEKSPAFDISEITNAADRAMQELPNYDASKVAENIQDGDVGQRGEVYFIAQAILIVSILLGGIPVVGEPLQAVLGPLLLLSGLAIGVLSVVDLGSDSLSPFPKPPSSGSLKTTGVYAQMRHPMYTALLTVMLGIAMISNSADRLLLTGFLYYLLEVKSDKEEVFLNEKYGADYNAYQVRMS